MAVADVAHADLDKTLTAGRHIDPALSTSRIDTDALSQALRHQASSGALSAVPEHVNESSAVKRSSRLAGARRSSSNVQRRPSIAAKQSSRRKHSDATTDPADDVDMVDDQLDEDGPADSKERSREKNKVAAAKCRAKKRENMEIIETNHRSLSAENSYLKRHEQQLRATVAQLRTLALDHQHCNCGVHQYNIVQAGNLARGLGDLHMHHLGMDPLPITHPEGGDVPTPESVMTSQESHGHAGMSPMFQEMNQIGLPMDLAEDHLMDLQHSNEPFFYDFNGSTEYSHDS